MSKETIQNNMDRLEYELDEAGFQQITLPEDVHGVFGTHGYTVDGFTVVFQGMEGLNAKFISSRSLEQGKAMDYLKSLGHDLITVTIAEGVPAFEKPGVVRDLMAKAYINVADTNRLLAAVGNRMGNNFYQFDSKVGINEDKGLITAIRRGVQAQKEKES